MADPRTRHLARVRRLRHSARSWTIAASGLFGATAVLLPYQGVGVPDAAWAAAAGGSAAIAFWRWADFRALAAEPVPEALDPAVRAARTRARLQSMVERVPIGRTALGEIRRVQHLSKLRGSAAAVAGMRLDRASRSLAALGPRVDPETTLEAAVAERALRDLAERTAAIERVLNLPASSGGPREQLTAAHAEMVSHLGDGVATYEGFVTAAASVVAESGLLGEPSARGRLTETSDRLRGVAEALAEFTTAARRQQA